MGLNFCMWIAGPSISEIMNLMVVKITALLGFHLLSRSLSNSHIFHLRKLRVKEGEKPVQVHTAGRWWSWDLEKDPSASRALGLFHPIGPYDPFTIRRQLTQRGTSPSWSRGRSPQETHLLCLSFTAGILMRATRDCQGIQGTWKVTSSVRRDLCHLVLVAS